jgi:putative SOS response-associated peptidase YedK
MIIKQANDLVGELHDRMPLIEEPSDIAAWPTGGAETELLKPAANEVPKRWPVSRRVNSFRATDKDSALIERIEWAALAQ